MASSIMPPMSPLPPRLGSPFHTKRLSSSRQVSGLQEADNASTVGLNHSMQGSRVTSRKFNAFGTTNITTVVTSLQRRSGEELGASVSSRLLTNTHASLLDWIRTQRMSLLPPEGSDYDKVLAWAQLFVERLHSFDLAIERFAGDSNLAAQLSYGYCAMLLELGRENAGPLMISFGFFYTLSMSLVNLLERTELFSVTPEIQEQLILALSDLVTLVASVSIHFHKTLRSVTSGAFSVNIYRTFPGQIQTFCQRCERISESMWKNQLLKEPLDADRVCEVKTIRAWLAPEDSAVSSLEDGASYLAHDREELTCLWMAPYLTRFLKSPKKHLAFTGAPGCGKSVLASVIIDQLQHSHAGVSYQTLFIPINARIPIQTSSHAIAKAILFQLLEKRIGNVPLLRILSDGFHRTNRAADQGTYENLLWATVEQAMGTTLQGAKDLIVVVDGVDETSGSEADLLQRLSIVISKAPNTKLVTLGAQTPVATSDLTHIQITDDHIFDDIAAVVRGCFESSPAFAELDVMDRDTIVEHITASANQSFLWAKLIVKLVREDYSGENILKTVETLLSEEPSIADLVRRTLQKKEVTTEAKLMLLWLATANRPLHSQELSALISIQSDKLTISDKPIDPSHVLKPLHSLVFLHNGFFHLRHGLIRTAFLDIFSTGKLIPSIKDRHADLTTRLLFYIKVNLVEQHEPSSVSSLDHHDAKALLDKHSLLQFALRYWVIHFRQTFTYSKSGEAAATKDLAPVLPALTTIILLQRTVFENAPPPQLLSYQTIITNVYRQILTVENVATLQAIISLAHLYRQLELTEALPLFHEVAILSQKLLGVRHTVTMQMVNIFLDITRTRITETKTDIMVKREEMLLLLVECLKVQYGRTSEQVISVLKQLEEHYKLVKEIEKAETITLQIQSLSSTEYSSGVSGSLRVHLVNRGGVAVSENGYVFRLDMEEEDEVIEKTELYDISTLIKLAERYLAEGKLESAERTYVEYWQRVTHEFRINSSAALEEKIIQVVLAYSSFLRSQKRVQEASSVLLSFWQDHQQVSVAISATTVAHLQEVATVMKEVGLSSTALTIYKHCSEYYHSTRSTETSSYQELQERIQITSRELIQSASSSSSSYVSETTIEEMIYEASSSRVSTDQSFYSATETIITQYIAQRRWQDATRVVTKVLENTWASLFASTLQDVVLPSKDVEKCVKLAESLAQCYHSRCRLVEEQDIRLRLYYALRLGRGVEDELRVHSIQQLLSLLERTLQTEMIISIHQELLNDYIKHYQSEEHTSVIKVLWKLAELTRPRPIFLDYYQRIIRVLNKNSECHPDALEPLNIVSAELWSQGRYSDALNYSTILFTAFLTQPTLSSKFKDQVFIQEIFNRHTQCLRSVRTEFSVLHKVTLDYQVQVKKVFSATASITIRATLTLARLCQESKQYEIEAITLYEELLRTKSEEINIKEISATLEALYEEQSSTLTRLETSESVSSTQVEQAVNVLRKRVTSFRETYGWAHEESLTKMKEIVSFHAKHKKTELVVKELQEATVQILMTETSASRLSEAATTIASMYSASHQTQKTVELTEEVYRQVVMKDMSNVKSSNFDLSTKSRQSLIFLAQLEYHLHRQSSSVTQILASLTTESVYFQHFHQEIRSQSATLISVVSSAARLHSVLVANKRQSIAARVFADFTDYFLGKVSKHTGFKPSAQVTVFVNMVLQYFSTHKSIDFARSVGIASNEYVASLLKAQKWDEARELAIASYRYMSAEESYHSSPSLGKFTLALAIKVSGYGSVRTASEEVRKSLLNTSAVILADVFKVLSELKVNLAQIGLEHLNTLIALLGAQRNYKTLEWLLTSLWSSREAQQNWDPYVTFALGRLFIMARYMVGNTSAAIRLAEDIVYNCRRVHGARHSSTLEVSVLLSQLYTAVGQRYQSHKKGHELASRYYKRATAIHENILRAFSDPVLAELEGNLDSSISFDGSTYEMDMAESSNGVAPIGDSIRQHLQLLKLSVQRLGGWPKAYSEYERLNADLFREYQTELEGVEGVERWDLKAFGSGKAESNADLINADFNDWSLFHTEEIAREQPVEEEL